jgi:hypothetical protein
VRWIFCYLDPEWRKLTNVKDDDLQSWTYRDTVFSPKVFHQLFQPPWDPEDVRCNDDCRKLYEYDMMTFQRKIILDDSASLWKYHRSNAEWKVWVEFFEKERLLYITVSYHDLSYHSSGLSGSDSNSMSDSDYESESGGQ